MSGAVFVSICLKAHDGSPPHWRPDLIIKTVPVGMGDGQPVRDGITGRRRLSSRAVRPAVRRGAIPHAKNDNAAGCESFGDDAGLDVAGWRPASAEGGLTIRTKMADPR